MMYEIWLHMDREDGECTEVGPVFWHSTLSVVRKVRVTLKANLPRGARAHYVIEEKPVEETT
jgi:hypothetical protein